MDEPEILDYTDQTLWTHEKILVDLRTRLQSPSLAVQKQADKVLLAYQKPFFNPAILPQHIRQIVELWTLRLSYGFLAPEFRYTLAKKCISICISTIADLLSNPNPNPTNNPDLEIYRKGIRISQLSILSSSDSTIVLPIGIMPVSEPTMKERRARAILSLYPEVFAASIRAGDRCRLCYAVYGENNGEGDKEPCFPRFTPCCYPRKFGTICLLEYWDDQGVKTCPGCGMDLGEMIEEDVRGQILRENGE